MQKVTKELQEAEYYSMTTDLRSSTGKLEPYLAVTVHYIIKEWELKFYCLKPFNTWIVLHECSF